MDVTYDRVRSAARIAAFHGRDLAEELGRLGLLATSERITQTRVDALTNLVATLEEYGAAAVLARKRGKPATPEDMFNHLLDVIRERIVAERSAT